MNEPVLGDADRGVAGDLQPGVPLWIADLGGGRPVDDPAVDLDDHVVFEEEVDLLCRLGDPDVDALDADAGSPEFADGLSLEPASCPARGLVALERAFERGAAFASSLTDGNEGGQIEGSVLFGASSMSSRVPGWTRAAMSRQVRATLVTGRPSTSPFSTARMLRMR